MDHYRGYATKPYLGSRIIFLKFFRQNYAYSQIFVFDFIVPLTLTSTDCQNYVKAREGGGLICHKPVSVNSSELGDFFDTELFVSRFWHPCLEIESILGFLILFLEVRNILQS